MNEVITTTLITAGVSIITAFFSYKQGAKKSEEEALRTAFDAYNFALESLRTEMENRTKSLMERITLLENENKELREKLYMFVNSRINLRGVQSEKGNCEDGNADC